MDLLLAWYGISTPSFLYTWTSSCKYLSALLSVLSPCLSGWLSLCLSVHSSVTLFVTSVYLSVYPSNLDCFCVYVYVYTRSDDKNNSAQYEAKTVLDLNLCFLLAWAMRWERLWCCVVFLMSDVVWCVLVWCDEWCCVTLLGDVLSYLMCSEMWWVGVEGHVRTCARVCISVRIDDKNNSAQYEAKTVLDLNLCFLLAWAMRWDEMGWDGMRCCVMYDVLRSDSLSSF